MASRSLIHLSSRITRRTLCGRPDLEVAVAVFTVPGVTCKVCLRAARKPKRKASK